MRGTGWYRREGSAEVGPSDVADLHMSRLASRPGSEAVIIMARPIREPDVAVICVVEYHSTVHHDQHRARGHLNLDLLPYGIVADAFHGQRLTKQMGAIMGQLDGLGQTIIMEA